MLYFPKQDQYMFFCFYKLITKYNKYNNIYIINIIENVLNVLKVESAIHLIFPHDPLAARPISCMNGIIYVSAGLESLIQPLNIITLVKELNC